MIKHLESEGQRVVLVGIDEKPISGSMNRFFVRLAWIRKDVWQEHLRLNDGRWVQLPEEHRKNPCSQLMKNAEFVIR